MGETVQIVSGSIASACPILTYCHSFVDGARGISTCMDGAEVSGIANTIIASCDAPNGDMLAAALATKYGWVHPTFGESNTINKRNDLRRLVETPQEGLEAFCASWTQQCGNIPGNSMTSSHCQNGKGYSKSEFYNTALVSCAIQVGSNPYLDMTEYLIEVNNLVDPSK